MLTGIRTSTSSVVTQETALDLLLGCHQRIRHFTAMARRLAESPATASDEVSDAADAVYRYFSVALPLHEADENDSIEPRLRATRDEAVLQAADKMLHQHRDINIVLKQLLPLWDALCREPEKLPGFVPRLLQLISQLEPMWDAHFHIEEETVFPAMQRLLSRQELADILYEMKERRGINDARIAG